MALQLTLRLDGKDKVYTADGINMRASVEAYKLLAECETAEGAYSQDLMDRLARFVARLFGDQFTVDELMDGCMDSFFRVVPAMLRAVIKGIGEGIEGIRTFPENPTTAAETLMRA